MLVGQTGLDLRQYCRKQRECHREDEEHTDCIHDDLAISTHHNIQSHVGSDDPYLFQDSRQHQVERRPFLNSSVSGVLLGSPLISSLLCGLRTNCCPLQIVAHKLLQYRGKVTLHPCHTMHANTQTHTRRSRMKNVNKQTTTTTAATAKYPRALLLESLEVLAIVMMRATAANIPAQAWVKTRCEQHSKWGLISANWYTPAHS